ncbi:MAG TPA: DNA primase [Lacipirellulaceae bacterium]
MSLGPGFDAKEQVRQAIDIVDLVGGYIQLRRQGRNFVGLCPWHDDSRPSLNVNPDRQSWKCWVCDVGGDVFSFVMKAEGLEFREALELLAEKAGIALRQPGQGGHDDSQPSGAQAGDKRVLLRVMAWAEDQFHRCLVDSPEGEPGRSYLAERGIARESIGRFHLGYAPQDWTWLRDRIRGTDWSAPLAERLGLLRRKEIGGEHYDWFRGRVMFSIRDARSRPIAFGGRVLPQLAGERDAKYINSPETSLFCKSRELYGLDMAREGIAQEHGIIVMEGYTDTIMAHQNGLTNVVAVLGTALGEGHLQLLRRFTDSITLVLDGDDAGRRRTNEIIDSLLALFVKNQVDLRILTLPEGLDPCDFIATHGSDAFRQLLATAVDALEHKFLSVTKGLDISTDTHRAAQAVEQVLASLAQFRPAAASAASTPVLLREQQMLGRVARQFHVAEEQLRIRLGALRRAAKSRQATSTATAMSPPSKQSVRLADLTACDRLLLEVVLSEPQNIPRIESLIGPDEIESPVVRQIYVTCLRLSEAGQRADFTRLVAEFDDPSIKSLLVDLDESASDRPPAEPERLLQDLVAAFQRRHEQSERRRALATSQQDEDYALAELDRLRTTKHAEGLKLWEQKRR